jgi:hypothetical protein
MKGEVNGQISHLRVYHRFVRLVVNLGVHWWLFVSFVVKVGFDLCQFVKFVAKLLLFLPQTNDLFYDEGDYSSRPKGIAGSRTYSGKISKEDEQS